MDRKRVVLVLILFPSRSPRGGLDPRERDGRQRRKHRAGRPHPGREGGSAPHVVAGWRDASVVPHRPRSESGGTEGAAGGRADARGPPFGVADREPEVRTGASRLLPECGGRRACRRGRCSARRRDPDPRSRRGLSLVGPASPMGGLDGAVHRPLFAVGVTRTDRRRRARWARYIPVPKSFDPRSASLGARRAHGVSADLMSLSDLPRATRATRWSWERQGYLEIAASSGDGRGRVARERRSWRIPS